MRLWLSKRLTPCLAMEAHGDARWREGFVLGITTGLVFCTYALVVYKIQKGVTLADKLGAIIQKIS